MKDKLYTVLQAISDDIRQSFGSPIKVSRLLTSYPSLIINIKEPRKSISAESVVQWHKFGEDFNPSFFYRKKGELLGWKWSGYWHSFSIYREEYEKISIEKIEIKTINLQEIYGFTASKSDLLDFQSIDEMAEENCKGLIKDVSLEGLSKCLNHKEIRVIHSPDTNDHFFKYKWDGRIWLSNAGGSHHTAAAQYISKKINEEVLITAKFRTYEINRKALQSIFKDFEVFAIGIKDTDAELAFNETMEDMRATWLWHYLPKPHHQLGRAVFLPKNNKKSMLVAKEFEKFGVVNLAKVLLNLTKVC